MSASDERQRLDAIAQDSPYGEGVNATMVRHGFRVLRPWLRPGSILELGPAEGHMTALLAEHTEDLTAVEGAGPLARALAERHPSITVVESLFEDFAPGRRYDNLIAGHVLEHVEDPGALLGEARGWLAPGGRLHLIVPNAYSLHRQAAVLMGLLETPHSFTPADVANGHRRVFDPASLRRLVTAAGWTVEHFGGYWLKPLSNAQVEAAWTEAMVDAFMRLGESHADIAAEMVVVAS